MLTDRVKVVVVSRTHLLAGSQVIITETRLVQGRAGRMETRLAQGCAGRIKGVTVLCGARSMRYFLSVLSVKKNTSIIIVLF
jgi:hypothetical protein